ncbi:MAG: winged helix-turn-helix domain-containing protein [Candidatus Methanoperedens sp.]|nr:winged helix-turn-helix domain-containing protein [Candidatus Methanoperedens sp.]
MKAKGLLSLIAFSEKRKEILSFVQKEPKTLQEIKDHFEVTSPEIIPQIKKLEKNYLVCQEDRKYVLTDIGKIVNNSLDQLVKTLDIFEKDLEFWNLHNLKGVPWEFRVRLYELGEFNIFKSTQTEMFKPHEEYLKNLLNSKFMFGVSPVLHPDYPKHIEMLRGKGIPISIIITRDVLEKLKENHKLELEKSLRSKNVQLLVYDENMEVAFTVTNNFLSVRFFLKNNNYDFYRNIISTEKSALRWGMDLFRYYEKRSSKIELQDF